jgi:tetracycline resistance efflux pump
VSDPTWISVPPPVLAIVLAIWTRQVYLSLAGGIWLGWTILEGWNPVAGLGASVEGAVAVFANAGDTEVILFTLVLRPAERFRGAPRQRIPPPNRG